MRRAGNSLDTMPYTHRSKAPLNQSGGLARLRATRWLPLLILVAIGVCAGKPAAAGESEAAAEKKEDSKITLPPTVETKLAELMKKIAEAKRKYWGLRMKKEIEDVTKVTGLSAESAKALETPAEQAIDQCMPGWASKQDELYRKQMNAMPDQALRMLEQMLPRAEIYARSEMGGNGDYVTPIEHPAWTDALKRTLTAQQAAAWEKTQAERKEALDKVIGQFLERSIENIREQNSKFILAKSAEIELVLKLSKETVEKLDALAKETADKSTEAWKRKVGKRLALMDDNQRKPIVEGKQGFYFGMDQEDLPGKQSSWNEGLAKILSSDEMKRLQAGEEERKSRSIHAMAEMMVALMDEKVAFTKSQRSRLQPVAERLVKEQMPTVLEDESNYYSLAPRTFLVAASKAPEGEVKPILDPIQWKHWQEAGASSNSGQNPAKGDGKADEPQQTGEPEDVERIASDFLQEKTAIKRKQILDALIVKAEDATRVAHLSEDVAARLQTAARGEGEASLAVWKASVEQVIRSNFLRDATPQNVKQQLAGIDDYYFGDRFSSNNGMGAPGKETLWDKTVKSELTAEQWLAWQKEVDERSAYQGKAIVSTLMSRFDQKNPLTPEQWKKLEPIIEGIVKDYTPDIKNYFSSSDGTPWFLQYYSLFFPFAGVPEKDFKAILTKDQWERWTGSQEYANSGNQWESLRQNHENRVKEAKQ